MINTADGREEAKGAILNDLERSEILAGNISPWYNLGGGEGGMNRHASKQA